MDYIRRAEDRGRANFGWLDSKHTFSFGHYYDPKHMGLSVLRVINDDTVQGGAGFDTHGHQDMEIISYVTEGAIEHRDSTGNHYQMTAGEVQRMSAGTGIMHSEYNAHRDQPLRFLQIWIQPDTLGIPPGYEQKKIEQNGAVTPLVTPDGRAGSLTIHQDASLYRVKLAPGESVALNAEGRAGYLHVVNGEAWAARVDGGTEQTQLRTGDGIGLTVCNGLSVTADTELEALWFDLPAVA